MLRRYLGHVGGRFRSLGPTAKARGNRLLQLRRVEAPRHIEMGARRSEVSFVELPDRRDVGLLDALFGGEHGSVRMVAVENFPEPFERNALGHGSRNGQ